MPYCLILRGRPILVIKTEDTKCSSVERDILHIYAIVFTCPKYMKLTGANLAYVQN